MLQRQGRVSPILACLLFEALVAATASAAPASWTSDWLLPGTPDLRNEVAAFSPDGDVLFASVSATGQDYQFTRTSPAGALRWSVALDGHEGASVPGIGALLPTVDGGAFVAFGASVDGYADTGYVAAIDQQGTVRWSRRLDSSSLSLAADGALVSSGCSEQPFAQGNISALDPADGRTLWQHSESNAAWSCLTGAPVTDAQGNVYVAIAAPPPDAGAGSPTFRTLKFDFAGNLLWALSFPGSMQPAGITGSLLFLWDSYEVGAMSESDGAVVWTTSEYPASVRAARVCPGVADPFVLTDYAVSRLSAQDGQPVWTTNTSAAFTRMDCLNGSLVLSGNTLVTRIDPDSGAALWSSQLYQPDAPGSAPLYYFATGAANSGALLSVARMPSFGAGSTFFAPLDFASGGSLLPGGSFPVIQRGLSGSSMIDDASHLLQWGVSLGPVAPEIHLRRLTANDGAVLWDAAVLAIPFPANIPGGLNNGYVPDIVGVASAQGVVAAAAAENGLGAYSANLPGTGWVALFERDTGALRWSVQLLDLYQRYTMMADPLILSNEDVVVAQGTPIIPYGGAVEPPSALASVFRLAAGDGHVVWRRDARTALPDSPLFDFVGAPAMSAVGDDIVVAGAFETAAGTSTLVRLSGSDGATQWSSQVLAPNGVTELHQPGDGSIIVVGVDGWARIDAGSGAVLWQSAAVTDPGCPPFVCSTYGAAVQTNGDVISSGSAYNAPLITRWRGDGSGIEDFWFPDPPNAVVHSHAYDVQIDAQDKIYMVLSRGLSDSADRVEFLAEFDPNTGLFGSQQAIGTWGGDPLNPTRSAAILGAPDQDRVFVGTFAVAMQVPLTSGVAMLDTTVAAHGDLAVAIETNPQSPAIGDVMSFHFTATYSGDAPAPGVTMIGRVPWGSGLKNVTCSAQQAGNCVVDTSSGNVHATFDVTPGARVDVVGQAVVLATPYSARFEASVHGTAALGENDTLNNFAVATPDRTLFRNGFE